MDEERAIMNKILSAGSPLSEWNVKVHCGIGLGYRKTFIVDDASDEAKYVCAVLNSELARWFALHNSTVACSKASGIEDMPIPQIGADELQEVITLVDEIIAAKADDPDADTWYKEFELNDLIYDLYGLTEEEDTTLERSLGLIHQTDEEEDAAIVRAIEEALAEGDRCDIDAAKEVLREISESRN